MTIITRLHEWWSRRLSRKLLIAGISTVTVSLIILGYLSFRAGQRVVENEVGSSNLRMARLVAQDINAQFDNIWGNVRLLMYQIETTEGAIPLAARAMLELRRASPLTYRALYLLDAEGTVLIHLDDSLNELLKIQNVAEVLDRPTIALSSDLTTAYTEAHTGEMYLSPVKIVGADQIPIVTMGIPIISEESQAFPIVIAQIDLRDIWRRVDEIRIGKSGRAFIVAEDERIIAHPDRAYIGQPLANELRDVMRGYEGYVEYTDPVSGRVMLAAYSPVSGKTTWGIVVEQERREALAPINTIAFITLGVLLAALALAIFNTSMTARSVTRPIQHLAEATEEIARTGDLTRDISVESRDEVGQLAVTFNQMIESLRDAQERLLATQAIAKELSIARQIQMSLLPDDSPLVPGLEIAAQCIPAQEVGGDFYDYYKLASTTQNPGEGLAVAVGDVSGKGIPAALYMAVTSSALASKAQFVPDVGQLCNELNDMLYPRMVINRMNAALLYSRFACHNHRWTAYIANAGFISPLLRRDMQCDYVNITGFPLGALPDVRYRKMELPLQADDWLVLCSDGIVEAMNQDRELYGFERLRERVLNAAVDSALNLINWIMNDVRKFMNGADQRDDMTVVVARFKV